MKQLGKILSFLAATILLAACAQQAPEPVTYAVEMSEYAFTPSTIEAKVGQQVTIELVNQGVLEHEIMFGHDVMKINNRPNGFQEDMFMVAHVEPQVMMQEEMGSMDGHGGEGDHSGFMVELPKTGDEATLTFTVTEDMVGEWEIGCFAQDGVHYDAGMHGKFVVTP